MKKLFGILILGMLSIVMLNAQNVVMRNDTVEVIQDGKKLKLPWGSGINSAHIGEIDLNLDGIMDLVLFEPNQEYNPTSGDKIMPFINKGTPTESDYTYAPEFRSKFPVMETYALFVDYNCDGKKDIFTYQDVGIGSIKVFKNISDNVLKFILVEDNIKTDISKLPPNFGHQNTIYWNYEDLIAVEDFDGDGDLDILTVDYIGSFFEYNKNLSMELYSHCDSLIYEIKNTCWGFMAEDFNTVILDTCHPYGNVPNPEYKGKPKIPGPNKRSKHSNTSLLAIDLDGDGDKDILTGDYTSPNLLAYYNGGKNDSAHTTSFTGPFPIQKPVDIFTYIMPFYVDINNDGKKDLVASVRLDNMQDTGSVWAYKNTGTTASPNFQYLTNGFLQNEMVDVGFRSKPVFFDYNQDGLLDIVVGNYGKFKDPSTDVSSLVLFENTGDLQAPAFKLVDRDFGGLSKINLHNSVDPSLSLHPTFGDLDNDGDEDMIVGGWNGKLHYFRNDPVNGKAVFHLAKRDFISIAFNSPAPQLFDVDGDSKLDLVIGEMFGLLHYYRNTSDTGVTFKKADTAFGKVDVKEFDEYIGFSVPFLFRDSLDKVHMIVGTARGYIQLYDSIIVGDTISKKFNRVEASYQHIWEGIYSSVHGGDLNNDGSIDFIIGNQSGGISLFTSEDSIYIPGIEPIEPTVKSWKLYPNPAKDNLRFELDCTCEGEFEYRVFNVLGKQQFALNGKDKMDISTSTLSSGVYFLRVENKNRSIQITERFVISR